MLSNICVEFSAMDDGTTADLHHAMSRRFSDLLMASLAKYPLLMPASLETTEALLTAVSKDYSLLLPKPKHESVADTEPRQAPQ